MPGLGLTMIIKSCWSETEASAFLLLLSHISFQQIQQSVSNKGEQEPATQQQPVHVRHFLSSASWYYHDINDLCALFARRARPVTPLPRRLSQQHRLQQHLLHVLLEVQIVGEGLRIDEILGAGQLTHDVCPDGCCRRDPWSGAGLGRQSSQRLADHVDGGVGAGSVDGHLPAHSGRSHPLPQACLPAATPTSCSLLFAFFDMQGFLAAPRTMM